MAKVRQDAWSHEDDLLLAETVLRHVREGSTQLNAFEEVGDALNRTSAACGFRWNAEVRKKYENAMDLAKRQRKEKKRALAKANAQIPQEPVVSLTTTYETNNLLLEPEETEVTMDTVIHFLQNIKKESYTSNQTKMALDKVKRENQELQEHVSELKRKLTQTEKQLTTIQEDYQAFIEIMERARKMTVLDGQSNLKAPMLRMDKNGNLEQVAQGLNP